MKSGYYIHLGARRELGLNKKIDAQIRELSKIAKITEIDLKKYEIKFSKLGKILYRIPVFYKCRYNYQKVVKDMISPDFIYIRRFFADKYFIYFMKMVKDKYPNCKIIIEIPTYPYIRDDYFNIESGPLVLKELGAIPYFKKYVDRFATYTKDSEIYNVQTLNIKNGVYVDTIKPRRVRESTNDVINILAVATFRKHHGYERIIKGLALYYRNGGKRNIILRLVGDGPEKQKYEKLVDKLKLSKRVLFLGRKNGKELDYEYNNADLALGSFGMYKIGIYHSSVLKIREYLAKGLPIVSGCHEDAFEEEEFNYYLEYPNDKSIIDIDRLIKFYDSIYQKENKDELNRNIREYANRNINYDVVFKNVISYISLDK